MRRREAITLLGGRSDRASPGDSTIEQPARFDFIIRLTVANALDPVACHATAARAAGVAIPRPHPADPFDTAMSRRFRLAAPIHPRAVFLLLCRLPPGDYAAAFETQG
jgi:hypothetical protein